MSEEGSIHAYDGELNAMTFNHVKGSKAFEKRNHDFIEVFDEDDMNWMNSNASTYNSSYDSNRSKQFDSEPHKTSEDGWNKQRRSPFTMASNS